MDDENLKPVAVSNLGKEKCHPIAIPHTLIRIGVGGMTAVPCMRKTRTLL